MKKAILATKVGMTQIFNEDGVLIPVTVLQAGPCVVTQIKTVENDGYEAVQVGFVDKKEKVINRDKAGKKEVIHRHGVNKAQNSGLKMRLSTHWHRKSKLTSSQLATESTLLQSAKVRASRVRSRDLVSTEDLWLMVPNSIVIRVPTVPAPLRAAYSRARECLVTWAA